MNLDKFYTSPEISKKFVEIINEKINLEDFDYVLEPSAGSGNILKYLPKKKQDWNRYCTRTQRGK